jgi:hypothetical protein
MRNRIIDVRLSGLCLLVEVKPISWAAAAAKAQKHFLVFEHFWQRGSVSEGVFARFPSTKLPTILFVYF